MPDGARIFTDGSIDCDQCCNPYWGWRTETEYSAVLLQDVGWAVQDMPEGDVSWLHLPNLSNLPAIDALDVLPECVRKVVQ